MSLSTLIASRTKAYHHSPQETRRQPIVHATRVTFMEAEAEAHRRQASALGPVTPRRLRKDFLPL